MEDAENKDLLRKTNLQRNTNQSVKRKEDDITIGDMVIMKNQTRIHKFDMNYSLPPVQVIDVTKRGVVLLKQSDGRTFNRHKYDVKRYYTPPVVTSHNQADHPVKHTH